MRMGGTMIRIVWSIAAAVCCVIVPVPPAFAQTTKPTPSQSASTAPSQKPSSLVSNVFVETDLREALGDISAQSGINIIADPSVQGVVTVGLQKVSVEKALHILLAGTPYEVKKTPDYYLVFSPDETGQAFPAVADTRVVQIHYLPADKAKSLLSVSLQGYVRVDETTDAMAITAPPKLMSRIISDLGKIDQPVSEPTKVVPLNYVKAATARDLLSPDLQRYVRVDADRNVLAVTAPSRLQQQIRTQLVNLDLPRHAGSFDVPDSHPTHVVKLNFATAKSTLALLPTSIQAFVHADEETNTLAISAPGVLLDQIRSDIAAIDTPRKHIMLDAKIVALERTDLLNFGGQWTMPTLTAGTAVGDAVKWPWALEIGYSPDRQFTNALSLTLNLLSQNNQATIIASPQVLAEDGKEADINATTEEYFPISAASGTYVQTSLEKIQTGTILKITPQIGANGDITLDMNIEVSDVIARGAQNLPVVSRRTAHSTIQIQNGGTAAVAGLVDTRSQSGDSGVPGFADVPLLGHAFRTETLNHQTRQVAVFVTATVVDDHDTTFKTGKPHKPAPIIVDANVYRQQLSAALQKLEGHTTK